MAAALPGEAILYAKPLARNVREAEPMMRAVKKAHVVNMICHNYRRIPAIPPAKQMIARSDVGDRVFHFRAHYAQANLKRRKSSKTQFRWRALPGRCGRDDLAIARAGEFGAEFRA